MQNRTLNTFTEEAVLFTSIIKWIVLSSITGAIVGGAVTIFLKLLEISTNTIHQWPYFYFFFPYFP